MNEREISELLVRLETKVDLLIEENKDKEKRMRALELRDAYVLVICGGVAIIAPIVAKKFFNF